MSAVERFHSSLAARVYRATLMGAVALGGVALVLGLLLYTYALIGQHVVTAYGLARTAANSVQHGSDYAPLVEEVMGIYHSLPEEEREQTGTDAYHARFAHVTETDTYDLVRGMLKSVLSNSNMADIYLAMYDSETSALVYIMDPGKEASMYPGDWEKADKREMEKFLNWDGTGRLYDVGMTRQYGWMCTAGFPITDQNGQTAAFVMVDVTLEEVAAGMKSFVLQFTLTLLLVTALIAFLSARRMKRTIVQPINAIAEAAANYVAGKRGGSDRPGGHFAALNIRTGDEIENLSLVMADMERDLAEYEEDLARTVSEKERISTELNVATQIQADMLPRIFPPFPDRSEFDLYATMTPAKEVGGDFYDFFLIDGNHLALVMADVSDKGVPAALFMVIAKTMLKNRALSGGSPKEILADINNQLCEGNEAALFVTVWLGILTISTGELVSASAGHEYPALCRNGQAFAMIRDPRGLPLAIMEDMEYEEAQMKLGHGDTLFIYTDGVPEASDSGGGFFGEQRMLDALNHHAGEAPDQILPGVRREIDAFANGAAQFDDITMLCLRFR